jgi:ABC-2 type transport system permease protein
MLRSLSLYRHVFSTGLQSALVYRWNVFLRSLFAMIHLVFVFALWGSAYAGMETIGGFSVRETLTYFIVLFYANFLITAWSEDYQISEEIRNGTINQFLVKPVSYFRYRLALFFAARAVTGTIALAPLLLLAPVLFPHLVLPDEGWRWAMLPVALLLAAVLQFCIAYIYGLLAFWFLDIQGFVILSMALETILSGQMFPLDLAPPVVAELLRWQPFYYMMYFPVGLATGRIGYEDALSGLAAQAFWTVALVALGAWVWRRGLVRHTAVGG